MTAQWITENLPKSPNGRVLLQANVDGHGGWTDIEIAALAQLTSTAPDAATHAALSALPISTAGWQPIWDAWKAEGLIS